MDCDIDLYSIFGCSARAKSIRGSKFLPPDWTNFGAFNFLPTHWRSLCAPKKKIISIPLLAAPKGVLSFVPIRFEIIIVLPCARLHVYILYIVVYFIFLFIIFFFVFFFSIHLPIVRHFQLQLPIFQCHWSSLTVIIVTVFRIVFEASHKSQVQRKQIIAQNWIKFNLDLVIAATIWMIYMVLHGS